MPWRVLLFRPLQAPCMHWSHPPKKIFFNTKRAHLSRSNPSSCHLHTAIQPSPRPAMQPHAPRHAVRYATAYNLIHHGRQPATPRYAACFSTVCSLLLHGMQPAPPRYAACSSELSSLLYPQDFLVIIQDVRTSSQLRPYMFPITSAHVCRKIGTCFHIVHLSRADYLGGLIRDRCALFCVKKRKLS